MLIVLNLLNQTRIMELNKKIIMKFGHYGHHPQDAEETVMMVPEDAIFFTGGENDTGRGKHTGAVHMVMITKASDEELENVSKQCCYAHIVKYSPDGRFKYKNFRVNGYGFIEFSDLIPVEGIEFTDQDKINELLDLANHPIYTVLFNDEYALSTISRIDRINSYYKVECKTIQLYSQLGSRYYPIIQTNVDTDLYNALTPFHEFHQFFPDEEYGKELFDEVMYTVLSDIYPEFKEKIIGYDLDYIKNIASYYTKKNKALNIVFDKENEEETKKQLIAAIEEFNKKYPEKPDINDDFNEISTLKKKLPIIKK